MKRRMFLLSICGVGTAALATNSGRGAVPPTRMEGSHIVNQMDRSIRVKVVGPFPDQAARPERDGVLFPEEEHVADLGRGNRVVLVWDHMGDRLLATKEVDLVAPSRIVIREDDIVVTTEL